jgi:mono/diheme cytochrome c family protein
MRPRQQTRSHRPVPGLAHGLLSLFLVACETAPPVESLVDWTPADHHSSDDDKATRGTQAPNSAAKVGAAGKGDDVASLVDLAWRQQCTSCHGPMGRGDGQMGPMVQAPDLTRADWQSKVSDAEMAAIIKTGRNRMPRFDLPAPVITGLVARIRSLQGP